MSGLYLHIPFCKQACSYCDFYFVTRTEQKKNFVDALINEIKYYAGTPYAEETVKTIYIGGGTPSLLSPKELSAIFDAINDTFQLELQEVTLEMNPDDVTKEYLSSLHDLGVDRASMGVQSFNPELLSFMNRAHNREEALRCLELLSQSGFQTFTVDLIYGNPGQSLEQLQDDVETLLKFDPPHISAYSLTVEPRTRLGKQVELGRIEPPKDDEVADHFDLINQLFLEQGIHRYEVSNYSKSGHKAIHNSNYWQHENYLGLGPGAHSFWWDGKAMRWSNKKDLRAYLDGSTKTMTDQEALGNIELAEERIMMGLRTHKGIVIDEFEQRYDYQFQDDQLEYLNDKQKEEKVEMDSTVRLTNKGIKIADAIILDLITLHKH
ncbi:MAG: radical SAM family heme chaperone HemW [Balneolaceae bacterium]|nr:radical SAM family heme chaperone HemW [Balneolaceae bacterium]